MSLSRCNTPTSRHVSTPRLFPGLDTPDSSSKTPRIQTPRILSTPRLDSENRTCFIAFIENLSREVGAAVLRIYPPSLTLYQYSDTALYSHSRHLIEVQNPTKILIPGNVSSKSPLSQMLSNDEVINEENSVVEVSRSRFSDSIGVDTLSDLANSDIDDHLINRYLSLSSAAACLYFAQVEYKLSIYSNSLKVTFQPLEGRLLIDPIALRQFSIISTPKKDSLIKLSTSKRKFCLPTLFNLVDRCFTPSGTRFLRSTIAAPPNNASIIKNRQDFIAEIVESTEIYEQLISIFSNIVDLDPVITFLVTKGTTKISGCSVAIDILQRLIYDIDKINTMHSIFSEMKCDLAQAMAQTIEQSDFAKINEQISVYLNPDPDILLNDQANNEVSRQIYALKDGIVGILDMTRKCYEETLSDISSHANDLETKYNIKISVKFNKSRRYFLQVNKKYLEKPNETIHVSSSVRDAVEKMGRSPSGYLIPNEFIHVSENSNYITATTFDLLILNRKNVSAQEDSIALAQKFIDGKIDEIRPFIRDIYKISEVVGFIDSLLSLASVARELTGYTKPKISKTQIYVLRNARHPIMERLIASNMASTISTLISDTNQPFIPNNLDITLAKPVSILKGVNMSGKTTYLQMAVQIAILAQCGSFVPCEHCVISPFSSIYTRSGTSDSIEGNASAFFVEMREMNHITCHANSLSLVAIDEPCISTSVRDGIGLAFACLEKLLESHAFVLCATHFTELEILADIYPLVALKEMCVREKQEGGYEYLYHIRDGSFSTSGYGIELAKQYYPQEMIEYTKEYYNFMKNNEKTKKQVKSGKAATSAILQQLLSLQASTLDDEALSNCILTIRNKCHCNNNSNK
ncbi:MutS domain III family protein [Tritrichomonas foetus]|uniref:MutS domain III family protein n=1 Tax=Tritrichomonas foetus TaxID=1144522 RepID=A0A1J4KPU8_9EUKA|nr:MutS domain III family protein [Tritrichomonas foetus]|eukprot:OHT11453.1 MutS domain III family protein [Tritrichomonas foetus]